MSHFVVNSRANHNVKAVVTCAIKDIAADMDAAAHIIMNFGVRIFSLQLLTLISIIFCFPSNNVRKTKSLIFSLNWFQNRCPLFWFPKFDVQFHKCLFNILTFKAHSTFDRNMLKTLERNENESINKLNQLLHCFQGFGSYG